MMEESSESTTKRRKVSGEEETVTMIDRISTLPDCVLCHILSFLPTKLAVATSILSNRWRSLWTLVPALDFKIRDFEIGMLVHMKFACIVYKILILTCPQSIKKLRLHYWIPSFDSDTSHLTSWFCTAVERKVEQIELVLSLKKGTFELPTTLFTCKTIVSLTLAGNITLNVPPSVNFPSLKKLLFLELIYSDDALEILLSGCPVLEVLFVESKFDVKWKTRLVTLKILSVEFSNNRDVPQILDVSVSSLKYFALTGSIYGDSYHIRHLDSLAVAELNVSADEGETCNLVRLLGNLRHTKILSLSSTTVESLHGGASSLALPEFPKLERLELTLQSSDLNLVEHLLRKSHKVEVLVIEKIDTCVNELCWKQPISIPDWLSSRLIMCKFRGYQGSKSELEFVKYVLKSASILKRMTIHLSCCLESEAKLKILNELSMVPIGSSTCELLLD